MKSKLKKSRVNHKVATLPFINKSDSKELEITIKQPVEMFKTPAKLLFATLNHIAVFTSSGN